MNSTIHKDTATFLHRVDNIDYGGVNVYAAMRSILEAIQAILPYQYSNIWLINEEQDFGSIHFSKTLSLVATAGIELTESIGNTYLFLNDSFTGNTVLQKKIVRSEDLSSEKLFKNKRLLQNYKIKTGLSVPLYEPVWQENPNLIGVLNFYFTVLPKIADKDLIFIASQVSNAIERLRLIHRDSVTSQLLAYSSGSLEVHYRQSISELQNYGVEAASIFSFDLLRNKLCLVATTGIINYSHHKLVQYNLGQGLTGHVGKYKKPIIVHNLNAKYIKSVHAGIFIEATKTGIKSFMAYPITNKENKLVGIIRCVNKLLDGVHVASFSQIDLNIVRRISRVLCQHMERAYLERHREALLAKIPHDLVAPIVAVRNNAMNIKDYRKFAGFNLDRKLDDIIDDCNIMFLLVQQVKRKRSYTFEKTQLKGEIIIKLIKALRPMAKSYNLQSIDYDNSLDNIPPDLLVDKAQMQHLMFNLIMNAIKYSFKETDIIISARKISNYIGIDVINWGIGIEDQYKEVIFEAEVRTPEAIEKDSTGTGWGLTICREIAESHAGKVVLTQLKNPTIFTLYLPQYMSERKLR
jgi:signal transduction histidine kinase